MEVWELKLYFYPSAGGLKKRKKKEAACVWYVDLGYSFSGLCVKTKKQARVHSKH